MRNQLNGRGISFIILILAVSIGFLSCSDGNQATGQGRTAINGKVAIENSSTKNLVENKSIFA